MTIEELREEISSSTKAFIEEQDADVDRNDLLDAIFTLTDDLFGQIVRHGRIDQYSVDDLVNTATDCAMIIQLADEDAWVEDDGGLWDGLTHGVLASIAFFSLEHIIQRYLEDAGVDLNSDLPFDSIPRKVYYAGSNMPGYMPDEPPYPCATIEDARQYLAEDIERDISDAYDLLSVDPSSAPEGNEVAELRDLKASILAGEYGCGTVGNRHYFIIEDTLTGEELRDCDCDPAEYEIA